MRTTAVRRDLETMLGNPKKAIVAMALPFMLSMLVIRINLFADTYWTAGLGAEASSAMNTVIPVYAMLAGIGSGLSVAVSSTIAYAIGQGDMDKANRLASNMILVSVILSVAGSLIVFALFDFAMTALGAGEIKDLCWAYMTPYLILSPIVTLHSSMGGMLRAEGASKRATLVYMGGAIANIIIDPVLIYGAGLGLSGASLSTCISGGISVLLALQWYLRGRTEVKLLRSNLHLRRGDTAELLDMAAPKTAELSVNEVTDLLQRGMIIIAGGTIAVMVFNLPWRYIYLAVVPAFAVGSGMIPVCSAAYGQRNLAKMEEGFRFSLMFVGVSTMLTAVLFFVLADPLMTFVSYEETVAEARPQLIWMMQMCSLIVPALALKSLGSSMMQAMKKPRIALYFTIAWGFMKLGAYAAVCQISFEAVVYAMIAVYWFGGVFMMAVALNRFRNLKAGFDGTVPA